MPRRGAVMEDQTPRTRVSRANAYSQGLVSEIMKEFDRHLMRKVRRDFDRVGDGEVDLDQFVDIMQYHLPNLARDHLCELFLEIDVNGDGTMEWDELTAFFVEKSSVYKTTKHNGYVVPYKHHPENGLRCLQDENEVTRLHYIDELDTVAVLRNRSKTIRLYDARDISSELGRLSGSKGSAICAEYIPSAEHRGSRLQPGQLVTSCSNLTLKVWQLAPGENQFTVQSCWPVAQAQASLCWVDQHRTLYSGSAAGSLHGWNVASRSERTSMSDGHSDITSALVNLQGLDSIASGGMDAEVFIWDLHSSTKRLKLSGHRNGVYALAYNYAHKLLFSGGVDHHAIVWSPFSRNPVYKLAGHKDSLVEMHNVPESDHLLVTGDSGGVFKLWDVRRYACVQTFHGEPPQVLHGMSSFAVARGVDPQKPSASGTHLLRGTAGAAVPAMVAACGSSSSPAGATAGSSGAGAAGSGSVEAAGGSNSNRPPYVSRIIAARKHLHVFDQCDPVVEMVSDDIPIIGAVVNTVSMTVITATGRSVKIWDLMTGKQLRKYDNLMPSDVTAICLDDRQRKFLLGDHSGHTSVFNFASGAFMKAIDPHKAEVSKLIYCKEHKNVVSVSWDRVIAVHSELDANQGVKLREMDDLFSHDGDITCADFDPTANRIVTGSMDKTVRMWDFFSGKMCHRFRCKADVSCVLFLQGAGLLAAADRSGKVHFWRVPAEGHAGDPEQSHGEFTSLRQCAHRKPDEGSSVSVMAWDPASRSLVLGDEYGSLRCLTVTGTKSFEEKWRVVGAHDDGFTSVQICAQFGLILSAGFDCSARAFSLEDGTRWGVLVNGAGRGAVRSRYWNVPFDPAALALASAKPGRKRPSLVGGLRLSKSSAPSSDHQRDEGGAEGKQTAAGESSETKLDLPITPKAVAGGSVDDKNDDDDSNGGGGSRSSSSKNNKLGFEDEEGGSATRAASGNGAGAGEGDYHYDDDDDAFLFEETKHAVDVPDSKAERRKLIHRMLSTPFDS